VTKKKKKMQNHKRITDFLNRSQHTQVTMRHFIHVTYTERTAAVSEH